MSDNIYVINHTNFDQYVAGLTPGINRQYDRGVNKDLSQQKWQGLFKRNVAFVLKQTYEDSLKYLQHLSMENKGVVLEQQLLNIVEQILHPFEDLRNELIQYALYKHRTSCALSNFPEEHNPSQDYINEVIEITSRDWKIFTFQVNAIMYR